MRSGRWIWRRSESCRARAPSFISKENSKLTAASLARARRASFLPACAERRYHYGWTELEEVHSSDVEWNKSLGLPLRS